MLFNSFQFLFLFLPAALAGYFLLGRLERPWAIVWLIGASFVFYAIWRPVNVLLIAPSILVNYGLSRALVRYRDVNPRTARAILLVGIVFNICFLGYFKYRNFFVGAVSDVFGLNLVLTHLILPLGISFITFQKIAFLVDVHSGRVESINLRDYSLFVLFFPQLVAGPIVHFREMMPQFHAASAKPLAENFAIGLSLLSFGLFKKVVLADPLSVFVSPLYAQAAGLHSITLFDSWIAAIGFTLQIYFDFSGYSDMALGVARLFSIKLPVNFNSPLRASSIIDFWLRWHVSLTRFLTAYIYNPLVLYLTRRRAARGIAGYGGANITTESFVTVLMFPTVTTMFVSGLWHGAGYQYILWGLIHGSLLTINHAWRVLRSRFWKNSDNYVRIMGPVGFVLTFFSVVIAMVMFRAPSVGTAFEIWKGMSGGFGATLPSEVFSRMGRAAILLKQLGIHETSSSGLLFLQEVVFIAALLLIALRAPNTLQLLENFEPALGIKARMGRQEARLRWAPSPAWAVGVALIAALGVLSLGQLSEFLYWQF